MTPSKCPGCGTKLEPDMLACPNCPMSFPEDEGDSGAVNPLKQSKYYQFVFPVLFFGAIGAIVWYLGSGLLHLGEANNQIETPNFLRSNPAAPSPSSPSAGEPRPEAPGSGDAKDSNDGGTVSIVRADDDSGRGPAREEAPQRPAAPAERVTEWKLRGTVYDLTTLKPLAGVSLTFADETTNRTVRTRSDSAGRYRVIVPPLDGRGYVVAVDKRGYAPNYLDPGTGGVREKDASERRSLARDLASTLAASPATVQSESAKPLVTDFYLAPRP